MGFEEYFNGSVEIAVKGFSQERFINMLAANGIRARDIRFFGSEIRLWLPPDDLRRIKPFLRKTGCRFRITAKKGLPFTVYKYRRRACFAVGFAFFFILLFFMSQFVWLIEIDGNSAVSDSELLDFFKKQGVYLGVNKHKINVTELKEGIRENFPQISWVSITQNGTRLLVDMAENVKNTDILDYSAPCDIISIRDCVVTDIIAQNGTPKIMAGDAVKAGDVLISAEFDTLDENGAPVPLAPVHSSGSVRGKWQTELTVEIPYKHIVKEYTGRYKNTYAVVFFGKEFKTGLFGTKFKKYDIIKRKHQLGFNADHPLPVSINKTVYCEYDTRELFYTPEQAEKRAELTINRKLINELPVTAEILEKNISFTHKEDKLTALVTLTVEDEVGKEREYTNGTDENNADRQ